MTDVPHNPDAELEVVGSMMLSVDVAETVMGIVGPDDLYVPAHRRLFACFAALRVEGVTPTITTAGAWLRAHPDSAPVPPALLREAVNAGTAVGVKRSAEIVREQSARRQVMRQAELALDAARTPSSGLTDAATFAQRAVDAAEMPSDHVQPGPDIDEWLAEHSAEPDWLIQGYLERRERLMLTGYAEKGGKTVMLRQLAMQAACGCRWFSSTRRVEPLRVLFVDCENPEGISRRWFERLRNVAGDWLDDAGRLVVKLRDDGLDLLHGRDRSWLFGVCEANRPDLLIIGPHYKLGLRDPNSEDEPMQLAAFFDLLRKRYDCAVMIEAHTPKAPPGQKRSLAVIGSSVWLRWIDFGLGIQQDGNAYELVQWASRDEREWPTTLHQATKPSEWPWQSVYPTAAMVDEL